MKRLSLMVLLVFSTALPVATQGPTPLGLQFLISSHPETSQHRPSISASASGSFVTVWSRFSYTESFDVFARRFDNEGAPADNEFRVNVDSNGSQRDPSVAVAAGGAFVVVWSNERSYGAFEVVGRRFEAGGTATGDDFLISSPATGGDQASVAMGDRGDFVAVWTAEGTDSSSDVFARRFDAFGFPRDGVFRVNTHVEGTQDQATVAWNPSGGFVVAWVSEFGKALRGRIRGQRFDVRGSPLGDELQISSAATEPESAPAIATDASGGFVVVWEEYDVLFGQQFHASGGMQGSRFPISQDRNGTATSPRVAMSQAGDFVVIWTTTTQSAQSGIRGQFFDRQGSRIGHELNVTDDLVDDRSPPTLSQLRSISDTDFFTVAWRQSIAQGVPEQKISGRRFEIVTTNILFADGFESGDTSAWPTIVGGL